MDKWLSSHSICLGVKVRILFDAFFSEKEDCRVKMVIRKCDSFMAVEFCLCWLMILATYKIRHLVKSNLLFHVLICDTSFCSINCLVCKYRKLMHRPMYVHFCDISLEHSFLNISWALVLFLVKSYSYICTYICMFT